MLTIRLASVLPALAIVGVLVSGCTTMRADQKETEILGRISKDRDLALRPAQAAPQCHKLDAFIPIGHMVEGPQCEDNKAVVNGWSEKCVGAGQCNAAARLGELDVAAEGFCAGWCASKNCGYRYTRGACDSSWCLASLFCQQNCNALLLDTCYFQKDVPNYNCKCDPRVEG